MARNLIMAIVMAVVLAVVVFTVVTALGSKPEAAAPVASNAPLELDLSGVRTLVDQAVDEKIAKLPPAPAPRPEQVPAAPEIRRVSLDGRDIADLLNLSMFKFAFHLPKAEYTNYVWMERWTRDAARPQVTLLAQTPGVWDSGELVIKLPAESQPGLFVRVNDLISRNTKLTSLDIPSPPHIDPLTRPQPIDPTAAQDICLVTYAYNESGASPEGRVDIHHDNDVTLYIKTRFTQGPFAPFELKPGQPADENNAGDEEAE
jgi:hypothetical protein